MGFLDIFILVFIIVCSIIFCIAGFKGIDENLMKQDQTLERYFKERYKKSIRQDEKLCPDKQ